ncbi:hypothetical protein H4R18_005094 [Coemansia javaensis]|uniref:Protein YOP1 n=1 Tax=Coemansia javaensis TaxID=2761396 RepID=A0A9W8H4A2_9FUNG|nr:hypothetical protein H4R18_005094 [Coemansia javaensis]
MFGLATRVLCVGVGYLYPAYKCFKLLRHGPAAAGAAAAAAGEQRDLVKGLLKHWVVMAGYTAVELVADTFIFWLPLVGLVKVAFVGWLVLPGINGAEIIYDRVVEPYLVDNEQALDGYLHHARTAAHRSAGAASLSAYDRWVGYMQQTIGQYTTSSAQPTSSPGPSPAAGQPGQGSGHPGLADLLRALSQRAPHTAAAAEDVPPAGVAGGAPAQQAGGSALVSVLTSWAASLTRGGPSGAGASDEQHLHDIRTRRLQLLEMAAQLERSERAILDRGHGQAQPQAEAAKRPAAAPHADGSEFEDDGVMVNTDSGNSSESRTSIPATGKEPKAATAAAASPSQSRRWFW